MHERTAALRDLSPLNVRFGSKADIIHDLADVRFTPECVAKLSLRPRANRDSVGLRGDSRERSMMGRREGGQGQFFYAFDLDKVVPPDHLVRQIDNVIDLSWVHQELTPYYSDTGRPSIDPVLMIRMLIVGYVFALRCRSIWPIGGFASSVSRTGYPIIRCSAVRGMIAFVRATPCAGCSRVWWRHALRLGLLVAKRSRLMRA